MFASNSDGRQQTGDRVFLRAQSSRIDNACTAISSSMRARTSESGSMSRMGCKLTRLGKLYLGVDISVNNVTILVGGIQCSDILRDELCVALVDEKVQKTTAKLPHSFPTDLLIIL